MCFAFSCLAAAAAAGPISVGVWYQFGFTDPGVGATGCAPADPAGPICLPSVGTPTTFADAPPWTVVLPAGGTLTVTDAFNSGDAFEVLNFGIPIGFTPFVGERADCGSDPEVCLADPEMSHRVYALAAGAHSFTIAPIDTVAASGSAYFRVDGPAVPEPSTLLLAAAGCVLLLSRRLRHWR
jgi:hypothetical protein